MPGLNFQAFTLEIRLKRLELWYPMYVSVEPEMRTSGLEANDDGLAFHEPLLGESNHLRNFGSEAHGAEETLVRGPELPP